MSGVLYDIIARADNTGFDQAEAAIDRMTGAQVRWNATANRWQNDSGRFVAANRVASTSAGSFAGTLTKVAGGLAAIAAGGAATAAVLALNAAMTLAQQKAKELWAEYYVGVRSAEALDTALSKLSKAGGSGSLFGIDEVDPYRVEKLTAMLNEFKSLSETSHSIASGGMGVSSAGMVYQLLYGDKDAKVVAAAADKSIEQLKSAVEEAQIFQTVTSQMFSGLTLSLNPGDAVDNVSLGNDSPFQDLMFSLIMGKPAPKTKESASLLEVLAAKNKELTGTIKQMYGPDRERIDALKQQNKLLDEQIKIHDRIEDMRTRGLIGQSIDRMSPLNPFSNRPRGITDVEGLKNAVIDSDAEYEAIRDRRIKSWYEDYQQAAHLASRLNRVMAAGMVDLLGSVIEGGGAVGQAFGTFLQSMGRSLIAAAPLGKIFNGPALAGLLETPGAPLALGAALVAAGSLLKRQFSSAHASAFGTDGGSSYGAMQDARWRTRGGLVDGSNLLIANDHTYDAISGNNGFGSFSGEIFRSSSVEVLQKLTNVVDRLERNGISGTLTTERGAFKAELKSQQMRDLFTAPNFSH